ncbi:MAG: hypothetical protein JOZ41_17435 [Chloroflexi bacterium]|nr:hypothetical protein [Chloroflexota bacterium]
MFVLGLLVGPAIGLFLARALDRSGRDQTRLALAVLALAILFVLAAALVRLELRLGLFVGALLGLLLAASPMTSDPETT